MQLKFQPAIAARYILAEFYPWFSSQVVHRRAGWGLALSKEYTNWSLKDVLSPHPIPKTNSM